MKQILFQLVKQIILEMRCAKNEDIFI